MADVSIVLPVRDCANFLPAALGSLEVQTFGEFEALLVDDGSRDGSRDILADVAHRDSRFRVLETNEDARGIVPALNLGLAEAVGSIIVRMDGDDVAAPDRLQRQLAAMQADRGLFASACSVEPIGEQVTDGMHTYLGWQNQLLTHDAMHRDRFVESPVVHPSLALRAQALRDLGGWQERGWAEDWDLVLRAFEAGLRFAKLPEVLLGWRMHAAQASRLDERCSARNFLKARAHYLVRYLRGDAGEAAGGFRGGRAVWILGGGPTAKRLARALFAEGFDVCGFSDVSPKRIGGGIRRPQAAGKGPTAQQPGLGDSAWKDATRRPDWPVISPADLREMHGAAFAVAAVGSRTGRERVREELDSWGWLEGQDFLVAA